jgi:hypothetical protein
LAENPKLAENVNFLLIRGLLFGSVEPTVEISGTGE